MAEIPPVHQAAEQFAPKARATARRAILLVLLPFLLASAAGLYLRIGAESAAQVDVVETAKALRPHLKGKAVHVGVEAHVAAVYGANCKSVTCDRQRALARTLAVRLKLDDPETDVKTIRARLDPLLARVTVDTVFAHGIYVLLVLLVGLMMIGQIRRTLRTYEAHRDATTFDGHVRFISAYLKLTEASAIRTLWVRAGVAFVIAGSFLYVIRPMGLRAAVLLDLVQQLQLGSEGSEPFWMTGMKDAPPVTLGIAGLLLYTFVLCTRRLAAGQLTDQTFSSLVTRAVVVFLTGMVLAGVYPSSTTAGAIVFLAGVFPRRGLDAIAKVAETSASKLSAADDDGFARMPSLTFWDQMALREQGIHTVAELAFADLEDLLGRASMQGRVLLDAVDRAILLQHVDDTAAAALAKIPIATASQLVEYVGAGDAQAADRRARLETTLGVIDLSGTLGAVTGEPNVQRIIELRGMGRARPSPAPANGDQPSVSNPQRA